jgi:RHS repeat-associated protein
MVASYDYKNNPAWEAIWGPGLDQLIEWRDYRGGKDYIPLVDHRNSVVAAWNVQQGRLTNTAYYNPEGRLSIQDSEGLLICREEGSGQVCQNPAAMPFGFGSAWRSQISGLVYMRNRWYSTETGQFISHDPLGYVDSYNLYAYVGFDPINGWDPYGLDTKSFASTTYTGENLERRLQEPGTTTVKTSNYTPPPVPSDPKREGRYVISLEEFLFRYKPLLEELEKAEKRLYEAEEYKNRIIGEKLQLEYDLEVLEHLRSGAVTNTYEPSANVHAEGTLGVFSFGFNMGVAAGTEVQKNTIDDSMRSQILEKRFKLEAKIKPEVEEAERLYNEAKRQYDDAKNKYDEFNLSVTVQVTPKLP